MSKQNLPQTPPPLSPLGYLQESLKAWTDFSQENARIVVGQLGAQKTGTSKPFDADAETMASEILRNLSDMNLRHWQNTARLLEGFPNWMHRPNTLTGSALVSWFDGLQRQSQKTFTAEAAPTVSAGPHTLDRPDGEADDLTRIKGIGAKISSRLNELGIYHFRQIANWTTADSEWVDECLSFKGRVQREAWIEQARKLSAKGSAQSH